MIIVERDNTVVKVRYVGDRGGELKAPLARRVGNQLLLHQAEPAIFGLCAFDSVSLNAHAEVLRQWRDIGDVNLAVSGTVNNSKERSVVWLAIHFRYFFPEVHRDGRNVGNANCSVLVVVAKIAVTPRKDVAIAAVI